MRRSSNLVLAVFAVLVLALAVVAAVASSRQDAAAPDTSTPEGVVQTYVAAIIRGDDETAVAQLDPSLGCTAPLQETWAPDSASVSVVSSTAAAQTATVVVDIDGGSGGAPLFVDPSSHRETFSLIRHSGRWVISGEPWPIYSCKDW